MSLIEKLRAGARSWGLLAGALVLGLLAFATSAWYLQSRQVAIENELMSQRGQHRAVVVATGPLQPGTVLSAENMSVAELPVKHLSENAVSPDDFGFFEGKVLTTTMSGGEVLLNHFVAGLGAQRFSDLLLQGERAVTISVDQIKSNDNMLVFGDRVDLLLVTEQADDADSAKKAQMLNPLVENVRVLAVGRYALATRDTDLSKKQESELDYSTLTVGVSVDDASRLLLARDLGSIVVMLRNREDKKPLDGRLLDKAALLAGEPGRKRGGFEFYSGSQLENGTLRAQMRPFARPRAAANGTGTPPAGDANAEPMGPPAAPVSPTAAAPAGDATATPLAGPAGRP